MSKEADRLIAWLGEVHAVPPFDVGGLVRDVETAAEERGRRRGVEELRDFDFALGQLRHLYSQMVGGFVRYPDQAARGLLGPAIEKLERAQEVASVSLPLSLAQRILAALEVEAYAKAGEEEYRAVFRALAAALRERMPK